MRPRSLVVRRLVAIGMWCVGRIALRPPYTETISSMALVRGPCKAMGTGPLAQRRVVFGPAVATMVVEPVRGSAHLRSTPGAVHRGRARRGHRPSAIGRRQSRPCGRPVRRARGVCRQSRPRRTPGDHSAVRARTVHLHDRTGLRAGVLRRAPPGRGARQHRRGSAARGGRADGRRASASCSISMQAPEQDSSPGRRPTRRRCRPPSSSSLRRSPPTRSPTRSSVTRSRIRSASWR